MPISKRPQGQEEPERTDAAAAPERNAFEQPAPAPVAEENAAEEARAPETPQKKRAEKFASPDKKTLNLCMKEKASVHPAVFASCLILILVVAALIGYFGVYMQYERVRVAQDELTKAEQKLDDLKKSVENYDDTQKQYNRYSYNGFDRSLADRNDILDLLERLVFPEWEVRSCNLSSNVLSITVAGHGMEFDDPDSDINLNSLCAKLREDELVESASWLQGGNTSTQDPTLFTASITIILKNAEGGN